MTKDDGVPSGVTPALLKNGIDIEIFRHCISLRDLDISFKGIMRSLVLCKAGDYSGNLIEVRCFSLFMLLQHSGLRFHYSSNLTLDLLIPVLLSYFALEFHTIFLISSILSCGVTLK